jgi:hypothetical protein
MKFKVGDVIVCMKDYRAYSRGEVYTVAVTYPEFPNLKDLITLEGDRSILADPEYFTKASDLNAYDKVIYGI